MTDILVLVLSFMVLLLLGVPIAFCLGISTAFTMLMSIQAMPALTTVAQRMATALDSFALLAIPFFILAGQLMNRGGVARRLIDLAKALVGMLPGGLAYVNILACMLFGAVSGSAAAAAAAIGGFMTPLMNKEGYDKNFSAVVNITSSTTGLLIPPSNILIVYSLASGGVSIAALFLAGYFPGIIVGVALMIVAGFIAHKKNYPVGARIAFKEGFMRFLEAIPSLSLLLVVMGGILAGYFTATEASAIAVLYTFILSVLIYREVKWKELPQILLDSAATTAIVMLLIGTSMGMSWIMSYENIPQNVSEALIALSDNKIVLLLIINLILLFVGTFMDMTPAVLIFTPIFLPVVVKLGMDPIHFGIIMVLNLCIGLCTPPVGSVLFIGCGVANTTVVKVLKPLIPMFIAMIVVLILVTYIPELSLALPKWFGF
ncbi:MAG: TRAP transporter large permease subunit [candidate division KSB1 bacterium]|nr:TRAP transporter large permease subunit [candidate division KSB1 bacterium]MDZ7273543.1 TRAP transporter large permease subunit [candidate division KSB1 bacterium]MDZ7286866.1 TRAP transporter large permease subunit [candidate division KSB1 bacterium]MDZ7299781.1 TRAP transporter large permease subunit [candidate division KSB1 bacterium]MDZ7307664.1 TRAP transporter large permease subunit [candidate division KSB1 bacterium]